MLTTLHSLPLRRTATFAIAMAIGLASCGSDSTDTTDDSSADTGATPEATAPPETTGSDLAVVAGAPFPAERCAANEAAGTVTFLTGFDFAAAASIVEVIVADAAGYYDDLCLDVEIRPGFSAQNYPLLASGSAQFASGGSFSEVVNFANANDASFIAASVAGRTAIDTLIVKAGVATELADLAGTTIGVKGKLPTSIEVMLLEAGLVEGDDFDTVLLEGFDPLAHIAQPIDALPGWKSNEVGALERAGVGISLFDPLEAGVPGSFGVIFTTAEFASEHPTAATDFMRATARGLADAVTDPAAAAATAVDLINAGGNPNFLSPDGETFRWETEAELILAGTPEGVGFGTPDLAVLQAELDAYAPTGVFGDDVSTLDASTYVASSVIDGVYDDDAVVIWPG
ncbi:MAG: ABC transporter substrate-binding protein [Ilumatobacter sp.]|uniref:ABC transporter substrate-binding protein n=1 Tax=Ilumatobacter sp. TaxID=1967498 RepID=UPI0039195712